MNHQPLPVAVTAILWCSWLDGHGFKVIVLTNASSHPLESRLVTGGAGAGEMPSNVPTVGRWTEILAAKSAFFIRCRGGTSARTRSEIYQRFIFQGKPPLHGAMSTAGMAVRLAGPGRAGLAGSRE